MPTNTIGNFFAQKRTSLKCLWLFTVNFLPRTSTTGRLEKYPLTSLKVVWFLKIYLCFKCLDSTITLTKFPLPTSVQGWARAPSGFFYSILIIAVCKTPQETWQEYFEKCERRHRKFHDIILAFFFTSKFRRPTCHSGNLVLLYGKKSYKDLTVFFIPFRYVDHKNMREKNIPQWLFELPPR